MPSAQKDITQLPAAGPITGSELVPIVQDGLTVRTTTQAISSAPNQQQSFLTVNAEPTLPNSRYLSTDSNLSLTNTGSALRISLNGAAASLNVAGVGFVSKDGSTVTSRTFLSGTGINITNGDGSGNPTISLTGQILNFANASANGILTLNSGGAVSSTYLQGVSGQTTVVNGNGISGPPTIGIDANAVFPGNGAVQIPTGTTAQRPTGVVGKIRYNTTDNVYEGYATGSWRAFSLAGGVTLVNSGNGLTGGPITGTGTLAIDTGVVATLTGNQTLTNKTISGLTNTLTNIGNASLVNSAVTVNGNMVYLGSSTTITAANPNALTIGTGLSGTSYTGSAPVTIAIDSTVVTLAGSQTLTNKFISGTTNTLSSIPNSALVNSSVTVNGNTVALGGSTTVTASTTNPLTIGSGLSGTSFNGGSAVTITNTAPMVYPGAGIPNSTGSAWGTSYATSGSGNVALTTSASLTTPTQTSYENWTPIAAPAYQEGRFWYDSTQKSLAYYNDTTNNAVHVGQELQQQVRNSTGSTVTKGTVVYISGATGQIGNITKAQANAFNTSLVLGVANQDIPNNTNGYIITIGTVSNLDTSAFADGNDLYLSPTTAGAYTNVLPVNPNYAVQVGICLHAHPTQGKVWVYPQYLGTNANNVVGLGTMGTQNANSVAITGGAIDGTAIGGTTSSTGKFTTVTATTGIFGGSFQRG